MMVVGLWMRNHEKLKKTDLASCSFYQPFTKKRFICTFESMEI